jgi:hypothetical protein
MFQLTQGELDDAFAAIERHGYSTMVPAAAEWTIIQANWAEVRAHIQSLDLDSYKPYAPLKVFAPKNRANVRIVHILHPQDLLIYTALVCIARRDIEANRISVRAQRVFSFRAPEAGRRGLYNSRGSHDRYRRQLLIKVQKSGVKYVAVADIADFYSRIYQHRLENVIESVATTQRTRDVARVLVRKFIGSVMGRNSYGIPIGPYASRVLGEAILIDVDAHLHTQSVDFVRWVDDYNLFCRSEYEAQALLFSLGEWLFTNHGLTLQAAKTRIVPKERFRDGLLSDPAALVSDRDSLVQALREVQVDYDGEEGDDDENDDDDDEAHEADLEAALAKLHASDLLGVLQQSLADTSLVDYEAVIYALTRLPKIPGDLQDLRRDVLDLVIAHAELLYPVAEHIAKYVLSFDALTPGERKAVGKRLLAPLRRKRGPPTPDYYAMWVLYIFSTSSDWNHVKDVLGIYKRSNSEVVRRYAALALAASGRRSDALAIKDDYTASSPLLQLSLLFACRRLGTDERKHWKLANQVAGVIEKLI